MGAFDSDRDLEFGQFAMRLGRVSGEQLQQAVDLHEQQAGSSLGEILVQIGALSTEDRKSLETLFAAHLLVDLDPPADSTVPSKLVSGAADTLGPDAIPFLGSEPEAVLPHEASRFERQELHAEGGLGKVFAAHDRQLNRTVALKEIKGHYADDRDSQARFTKEAEITGRLEHPGIVPVYALGRYADGRPYYAMRFVKGHSLRAAIGKYHSDDSLSRASRALQMRALLGRLVDVCDAVYYAHRRGIVHRDLKPSNIMLGDYGETLVVDWGLAKNLGKRESPTASLLPKEDTLLPAHGSSLSKTMVGKAIGSPAFMSPEQARGEHDSVEFASDIYGLGATLYMILTGRPPVEGKSSAEVLSRVRKGEIDRLRSVDRSIPRPLEAICHKALALEAVDRYPTVRDLRHDLDRFLADEPVTVYRESLLEKGMRVSRRRRWLFPVILVGLLGLITVTGVSMLNVRAKERAVTAAFGQIANAYRVIDPFDDNEANIERLEAECARIQTSEIPEISKAMVYDSLVLQFNKFKRPAVATVWAEEALEISKRELGPKHDATLERQRRFAQTLNIDGQYDRAAELLKDAIERKSPQGDALYFGLLHDLSAIDYKLGRWSEAIPLTEQVVEYRERDLGADHPRTLATKHQLGLALSNLGRHEAATEVLQEVAAAVETAEGLSLANRLSMQSTPLVHQYRQGAYAEALSGFETLYPDFIEHLGPSHPQTITMQLSIASAQRALGRVDEAIDNLRDVIRKREEVLGPQHEHVWHAKLGLASALLAKGDFEQAVATAEPALEWYIQQRGFGHHQAHRGSQTLAYALLALERFDEAHEVVTRWQATDADVLPELKFSAELAAAEIALGRQNLGTARERQSAAAQYLVSDETSADAAGLHSLEGALALRAGKLTEAETELNAAKRILDTPSMPLQAHQRFWADVVARRLNEVRRQRADASPDA